MGEYCSGFVSLSTQLDQAHKMCYSAQDCANINTVWASLIIEECCRLGLMVRLSIYKSIYF